MKKANKLMMEKEGMVVEMQQGTRSSSNAVELRSRKKIIKLKFATVRNDQKSRNLGKVLFGQT